MEEKNYKVYMHICPNGKKYIGITKQEVNKRWRKGLGYKDNNYFFKAITKHKWENIEHKIVYKNLTKEEAEEKEIELIKKYNSNNRIYGYNIENGGHINCVSNKTKKQISKTMKEKRVYEKNPNAFKKNQKPWITGKNHTKETIKKIKDKRAKQILETNKVICIETGEIFNSAKECENKYSFNAKNIRRVCSGQRKTAHNYHWEYIKPKNRKNKKYN